MGGGIGENPWESTDRTSATVVTLRCQLWSGPGAGVRSKVKEGQTRHVHGDAGGFSWLGWGTTFWSPSVQRLSSLRKLEVGSFCGSEGSALLAGDRNTLAEICRGQKGWASPWGIWRRWRGPGKESSHTESIGD